MAQPQVLQGTWEEIVALAPQLEGRNDLLLIIPAKGAEQKTKEPPLSLIDAMKDYIGSADYGDANLSIDTGEKFGRLLSEKYRKEYYSGYL